MYNWLRSPDVDLTSSSIQFDMCVYNIEHWTDFVFSLLTPVERCIAFAVETHAFHVVLVLFVILFTWIRPLKAILQTWGSEIRGPFTTVWLRWERKNALFTSAKKGDKVRLENNVNQMKLTEIISQRMSYRKTGSDRRTFIVRGW